MLFNKNDISEEIASRPIREGYDLKAPFELLVDRKYKSFGRGITVQGMVTSGTIETGNRIQIVRDGKVIAESDVIYVRLYYKREYRTLFSAHAGDEVELSFRDIPDGVIRIGDYIKRKNDE